MKKLSILFAVLLLSLSLVAQPNNVSDVIQDGDDNIADNDHDHNSDANNDGSAHNSE